MNPDFNYNTNKPWNSDKDYWWENPGSKFWGLRNPNASYNRILFAKCGNGIIVFWVNVKNTYGTTPFQYVNRREVMTLDEARHLWNSLIHPSQGFVPDDSTPPRKVNPCHDPSFKSVASKYSKSYDISDSYDISKSYDKYVEYQNKSKRKKYDPMEMIEELDGA